MSKKEISSHIRIEDGDAPKQQIAVIGIGYWGKNLLRSFHQLGVLAAACDSDKSQLDYFRSSYPQCRFLDSYDRLLADASIQAVAIATPAIQHASMVEKALRAGKDVLVEKPLSLDIESARSLIALARERKRILMVGHLLWYHPAILKLKQFVDAGELGRLQYIYSNRLNLGKIRQEENILWSFAPHDISVILGLLGEMPDKIIAQGANYLNPKVADVTVTCLSFPSGVRAHVFVSWLHPYKEQKLVIVGDKKMAVFNDVFPDRKLLVYPHSIQWKEHIPVAGRAEAQDISIDNEEPLLAECRHFLDCVASRRAPRTDGEEALRVLTVLDQCQKALDSGNPTPTSNGPNVHPSAFIDPGATVGEGTTIWHVSHILKDCRIGKGCRIGQNVVIGPNVRVGNKVKIQNNVSVYEGVTLEDEVFCGPSMVFTNVINPRSAVPRMKELRKTQVKQGATLGANCTVVCGVEIGRYAFIGAGAVVTHDVPDFALMVGVPARQRGWVCRCGVKLKLVKNRAQCPECNRRYRYNRKGGMMPAGEKSK